MEADIIFCQGNNIKKLSRNKWQENLIHISKAGDSRTNFMTNEHHLVRYFLAEQLPKMGKPISVKLISKSLNLPINKIKRILNDLENGNIFIIRDENGSVSWTFPITVEKTSHKLTFSTGEQLYGA